LLDTTVHIYIFNQLCKEYRSINKVIFVKDMEYWKTIYIILCQGKVNLRDLSLFTVLLFAVMMTVLSARSIVEVGYEYEFNAQAQMTVERQQDQQQSISSLTAPSTTGTLPSIEITSHNSGQQVELGPLTISGTSSDTPSIDCEVYADWNDNKPFGKAVAAGPGGSDDYSKWTFTYGTGYHLIKNGTNNLTSKISCVDEPTNSTKWSSINLIGVDGLNSTGGLDSESTINQAITTGLPSPPSPIGLPLPTPNQAGVTSSSLDPVVGEANEEDEDSNEDDDADSDDSDVENEDDSSEEDEEDNNGSEGEDSGDNENGSGSDGSDGGDGGDDSDEDNDLIDFGPGFPFDFDIDDFLD